MMGRVGLFVAGLLLIIRSIQQIVVGESIYRGVALHDIFSYVAIPIGLLCIWGGPSKSKKMATSLFAPNAALLIRGQKTESHALNAGRSLSPWKGSMSVTQS